VARRRNEPEEFVDLRAPEHAWWAARPTDPFAPPEPEPEPEPPAAEEVAPETLAEDFPDLEIPVELGAVGIDPYLVLRLPPTATWEEIVSNYRRLARWWHPDGLGAAAEWGRAACEDKIRQLNAAYSELRIRRGR
jgi:hypothetical protein